MNKPRKSTILAAAILAVGLAAGGIGAVKAASNSTSTNPVSNLVNAIAQRFNLNPTDVQQVFDQQRSQMEAQRFQNLEQKLSDRVAQGVKDGKLTQAQADLITAKMKEVEAFKQTLDGKTPAERQTAMKTEIQSLKQWAKDNNIPTQYLLGGMGFGGHGHHGRMGMGMMGWNK